MTLPTAAPIPAILTRSAALLGQGAALAAVLTGEQYRAIAPGTEASSVGAHLRHCVEFYRILLASVDSGEVDYDLRPREARLESDPMHAMLALQEIARTLPSHALDKLDMAIRVRHDYEAEREEDWAGSTLGRELHYLFSHTVHHYALIAAQLRHIGLPIPEGFGISPATLRFRQHCRCAPSVAATG